MKYLLFFTLFIFISCQDSTNKIEAFDSDVLAESPSDSSQISSTTGLQTSQEDIKLFVYVKFETEMKQDANALRSMGYKDEIPDKVFREIYLTKIYEKSPVTFSNEKMQMLEDAAEKNLKQQLKSEMFKSYTIKSVETESFMSYQQASEKWHDETDAEEMRFSPDSFD